MPIYNKLVRDCIPEIIERSGKKYTTRVLDQTELIKELKKKCFEELEEYTNAENDGEALEELADLLEIIHALAGVHGGSFDKVEELRKLKAEKRGKFKEKIFLVEVEK